MKGSTGERLEWDAIQALSAMKNGSSLTSSPSGSEKTTVPQLPSGLLINQPHRLNENSIKFANGGKPILPSLQQQMFQPQFVPILSAQDISLYLQQQQQQQQQQLLNLSPSYPTLSSLPFTNQLVQPSIQPLVVSNGISQGNDYKLENDICRHEHNHNHNHDDHQHHRHHHHEQEQDQEHEHDYHHGHTFNYTNPSNDSDNDNDNNNSNGNQNINGQNRLVGNCFGCGRSKSRVYKYLGVHSPICNACNQHWRRDEHKLKNCTRCMVLAGLNADLSLRGTSANERQERALRNAAAAAAAAACGLPFTPGSAAKKNKMAAMNMNMGSISKSNSNNSDNQTSSGGSTDDNKAPIVMNNQLLCAV